MCHAHWLPRVEYSICYDQGGTVQLVRGVCICAPRWKTKPHIIRHFRWHVPRHGCVIVMGDFNAKLPRNNGRLNGRWCIHSRANQAGNMLSRLMERRQQCAVSTLHQPRRHTNNATYLAKYSRYGPSQIDYILAACIWASSAHTSRIKWGMSCQRRGRHYDHGLVSCDWQCRVKSHGQQVKPDGDRARMPTARLSLFITVSREGVTGLTHYRPSAKLISQLLYSVIKKSVDESPPPSTKVQVLNLTCHCPHSLCIAVGGQHPSRKPRRDAGRLSTSPDTNTHPVWEWQQEKTLSYNGLRTPWNHQTKVPRGCNQLLK